MYQVHACAQSDALGSTGIRLCVLVLGEPSVDVLEERLAALIEVLIEIFDVACGYERIRGHTLEARGRLALRVDVVSERRTVIVQRDARLAQHVGIERTADVFVGAHFVDSRTALGNQFEFQQLFGQGAMRRVAGIFFEQCLEALVFALRRQPRRLTVGPDELGVEMLA